jgi:hypothetical protein
MAAITAAPDPAPDDENAIALSFKTSNYPVIVAALAAKGYPQIGFSEARSSSDGKYSFG